MTYRCPLCNHEVESPVPVVDVWHFCLKAPSSARYQKLREVQDVAL